MMRLVVLRILACAVTSVLFVVQGYAQRESCDACSTTLGQNVADTSRALVYVKDTVAFRNWINANLSYAHLIKQSNPNLFDISKLNRGDYQRLRLAPAVCAISLKRKAFPEREIGGVDLTLNSITTAHNEYPLFNGHGLIVSVKEGAFDKSDIDFYNRVFQPELMPSESSLHATTMATVIGGAGISSPEGRGVANDARLAFASSDNLNPEDTEQLRDYGVTVQNHSYGTGIENEYGIESHLFDKQAFDYPELVLVFSAGNSGGSTALSGSYANVQGYANLTGQFKLSKNTIAVGNTNTLGELASLSSRGPAHDGRIKPEIVAHGDQGSSEAAAIVSGTSLLLQQVYRDNNGGVLPNSSLIKAVLVNSADDNGRPQVDYEYGFGSVDALGSIRTLSDERYFVDQVGENEVKTFNINVPPNSRELKVTLVWTDKEAEPGAVKALINDLDLEVLHVASNTLYAPWSLSTFAHVDSLKKNAMRRPDHLNTIEQVTVANAVSGDYQIRVKGFDLSNASQTFSLAYEFVNEFEWIYPTTSDVLVAGETKILRWKWNGSAITGTLEWRIQGDAEWEMISEVDMDDEYFSWLTPSINDVIELRLSWNSAEYISEPVRVSGLLFPFVGYYCDPEGLALWDKDESDSYNVYTLGEKSLELSINGSDTLYFKTENTSPFMSVASVVKGKEGRRSRLLGFRSGVCYITSFLPEEVVTDSVSLLLTLGTNIGVKYFDLERMTPQGWMVVLSIAQVVGTEFTLHDPSPVPGTNQYRIRLTRDDDQQVVSNVEEVFFINEGDLRFFPNPVIRGEPITIVVETEVAEIWILDMLGRPVKAFYDDAELKTIETSAMVSGVYVVKTISSDGQVLVGRIVVK
jgi:hypothetical protein